MYKNNSATTDKRPEKHGHTFVSSATTCHAPKWEHSWVPKNVQTFDAFERKHFPVSQNHKDHKLNCCMEFHLCQNHAFGSAWSFLDLKISWHMFFVVVFLHFWQGYDYVSPFSVKFPRIVCLYSYEAISLATSGVRFWACCASGLRNCLDKVTIKTWFMVLLDVS